MLKILSGLTLLVLVLAGCGAEQDSVPPAQPAVASPTSSAPWSSVFGTTPTPQASAASQSPAQAITVVESGFTRVEEFVSWGAVVENRSGSTVQFGAVAATAYTSGGDALNSSRVNIPLLRAGERRVVGSVLTNATAFARGDVVVSDAGRSDTRAYRVGEVKATAKVSSSSQFGPKFSVSMTSTLPFEVPSGTPISLLFRDKVGQVVGGADGDLSVGVQPSQSSTESPLMATVLPASTASIESTIDIGLLLLNGG
jgi:hypothetical protein